VVKARQVQAIVLAELGGVMLALVEVLVVQERLAVQVQVVAVLADIQVLGVLAGGFPLLPEQVQVVAVGAVVMVLAVVVLAYWVKAQMELPEVVVAVLAAEVLVAQVDKASILYFVVRLITEVLAVLMEVGLEILIVSGVALPLVALFALYGPATLEPSHQPT
jgi:hypothetical protein